MQTANPFRIAWQALRPQGFFAPLDGLGAFYLGLEPGAVVMLEAALSADPLCWEAEGAH